MQQSDLSESIPDSEGEEEEIIKFPTIPQTVASTISEFTAQHASKPVEKTSPVSEFTMDKDKPAKVRVRPQPRKPRLSSTINSFDSSSSSAAGPSSHLNIFDAAARARQENLLKAKGWKLPPPEQSTKSGAEVIHIDSSSGDEWIAEHLRSEKARKSAAASTQGAAQSQASLPIAPDTSILPPSDPPTSSLPPPPPKRPSERPLSTPAVVRKNKRSRAFEDDDDDVRLSNRFLGFFPPVSTTPSVQPEKDEDGKKTPGKPKKARSKKATGIDGEPSTTKAKKPKAQPPKKRNATAESSAQFKSAEFILDSSDDELSLQPTSKPGTMQKSDPPSTNVSAPPSIPFSDPSTIFITTNRPQSSSVLPSPDATVPPSVDTPRGDLSRRPDTENETEEPILNVKKNKRSDSTSTVPVSSKGSTGAAAKRKKSSKVISDSEDDDQVPTKPASSGAQLQDEEPQGDADKENSLRMESRTTTIPPTTPSVAPTPRPTARPRSSTPYTVPHRKGSMSDLIRRVSSKVNSPLASPAPAYSPLAKSTKAVLSRIAPLHVNRRTPPPARPPPPPPKKTKKMLELEEKWEMELADSVEGWSCLPDEERASMLRAKRDMELGFDD